LDDSFLIILLAYLLNRIYGEPFLAIYGL